MTGDCCREARRPLGVAAGGALLALLVPKCPLCLATYLSFLGAAASTVVWLRPLGVALTVVGLAIATWRYLRRRPSSSRSSTAAAKGVLEGLEKGEDRPVAEGFRNGIAKALERELAVYRPGAQPPGASR